MKETNLKQFAWSTSDTWKEEGKKSYIASEKNMNKHNRTWYFSTMCFPLADVRNIQQGVSDNLVPVTILAKNNIRKYTCDSFIKLISIEYKRHMVIRINKVSSERYWNNIIGN